METDGTYDRTQIRLRAPNKADVPVHAGRPKSAEIHRMYGGRDAAFAPSTAQSRQWYEWLTNQPVGRIIEVDGDAVGEIRLHSVSEHDRSARLAVGLFFETMLGKGVGRHAVQLMLAHGFGPMALHRIELVVMAFNTRAIRCYQACGFVKEGVLREAVLLDDGWHDEWIMSILSHDYAQRINNQASAAAGARTQEGVTP